MRGTPGIGASATMPARGSRAVTVPSQIVMSSPRSSTRTGTAAARASVMEGAVESDHSDTSTSKRSPTSEPVAVPTAPGAAANDASGRGPDDTSVAAR